MATFGDFFKALNEYGFGVPESKTIPVVILNPDGDEVFYNVTGYSDDDEAFVITLQDFDVQAPTSTTVAETITVTVPKGVEVKVETANE